ncbi:hypothetical protein BDZ97DRAFT_1951555 [Flammula alnicola]|nr:hypothetical protein BDZ97DRAFT_1951555 [Flammula alnicola]
MSKPPSSSNAYSTRRENAGHDKVDSLKTSYGIMPTPPSPIENSPTLTQSVSNSASSSSNSPPEPTTPPRVNRSRTRYPDLGRVPLHRRGTSKTYERMEDLLKEAGYKETRIFTPETERSEENTSDDKRLSVKDGMEAFVGFLAGLMPSATASKTSLPSTRQSSVASPQEYSPPVSPLSQRYPQRNATRHSFDSTEPPTPTNMTSSIESLQDPTPRVPTRQHISRSNSPAPTIMHANTHPPYYQQQPPLIIRNTSQVSYYASHQMQKQPSRSSINHQSHAQSNQSNNNVVSPRPSRAGAYLRHMTSVPTMPPRPNSTPVHLLNRPRIQLNDSDSEGPGSTYSRRGNGEGESEDEPPLPPTWLETVARAVLFGGTGAYVGGPTTFAAPEPPIPSAASSRVSRVQVLRPTRSSLSQVSSRRLKQHQRPATARSGLSDQTNTANAGGNSFLVPPPPLFSKIERGRAGKSEGEVSKTRVVCRSAPGSRSGSVARSPAEDRREKHKERGRDRRKKGDKDRLPSLARTQTEGDIWSRQRHEARAFSAASSNANRYLSGWGADLESDDDEHGAGPSSEDEEEGELDLARILVPPKRQNSIKSLRKHLASENAGPSAQATLKNIAGAIIPGARTSRAVTVVSGGPPSIMRRRPMEEDWDGQNQEWGGGWLRKGRRSRGSDDDDVDSFNGFFGEGRTGLVGTGRSGTGKSRLGFHGAWGLAGGTGS